MAQDDVHDLRAQIKSAFAAIPFDGEVTLADCEEWREELDDYLDLAATLKGQKWTSIPAEYIACVAIPRH